MKKGLLSIFIWLSVLALSCYGISKLITNDTNKKENIVVSSFYPEYIILMNLLDNCNFISIKNMTVSASGCLHDYQLTTSDMKQLEKADAFIINGGGMETFLDKITNVYPNLKIIDSSTNIDLLKNNTEHSHSNEIKTHHSESTDKTNNIPSHNEESENHENESHSHKNNHNHGDFNSHIWLNPTNYIKQIKNISYELCKVYPNEKKLITKNTSTYISKIKKLNTDISKIRNTINKSQNNDIIIFHDSFAYIAQYLGLNIIECVNIDSDSSISTKTLKNTLDEIKYHNIKILFTEKQFDKKATNIISSETNAKVYTLDSLVTGPNNKNSYINGMKKNIITLKKIYKCK